MKAVIFDLDGTLVNSLEDLMDSTNYAMSKVGAKQINIEQTRQYVGNGADMLVKRALGSETLINYSRGRTGCYNWYQSRSVRPAKLLSPSCLMSFNPLVRDMCVETLSVLSCFLFDCV